MEKLSRHAKIQTSETFLLSSILALSGGFQDAYTYNVRNGVFSNAQTGNVVLMSQHLMQGEWMRALHYLFQVLAFELAFSWQNGLDILIRMRERSTGGRSLF